MLATWAMPHYTTEGTLTSGLFHLARCSNMHSSPRLLVDVAHSFSGGALEMPLL